MDWAGMLFRMYKRFAERRGFKITIMEEIPADFGIKSVEMRIEGPFAYGYLSGEKGTHRLVRISPFNAQGKRQTSFAGIETWPILEEKEIVNIDIPDKVRRVLNCLCEIENTRIFLHSKSLILVHSKSLFSLLTLLFYSHPSCFGDRYGLPSHSISLHFFFLCII